jgi:ribosomal protein S18 acetylase RimI-like enzyme
MATEDVSIEAPDIDQVDALAALWVDLAAGQREHGSHIEPGPNRTQIRKRLLRDVAADRVLIARTAELCGFVMFSLEQGAFQQDTTRGFVENLYVRPEDRNAGIGTDLLRAAERALRERGVERVALNVMAMNDPARRFYRRHGYEPHRVELQRRVDEE